jgi:hypothetical protein
MSGRVPGALSFLVSAINNKERVGLRRQFFTWPPNTRTSTTSMFQKTIVTPTSRSFLKFIRISNTITTRMCTIATIAQAKVK